jgi:hypothetical protein
MYTDPYKLERDRCLIVIADRLGAAALSWKSSFARLEGSIT